jgi:hypothetical protein
MNHPAFNYNQDFNITDFRRHRELYQIGRGEQATLVFAPEGMSVNSSGE